MNAYAMIEALAAAPDSVVIPIGTGNDLVPTEFLRCGESSWIAPCPCCSSGVIETDSPDFAAAKCDACFDAEPIPEAVQAPPAPKAPTYPPIMERPSSLVISSGRVPLPGYVDSRPVYTPKPSPQCKRCGRYMAPDNSSGHIGNICGTCVNEKAAAKSKADHRCRECNGLMTGSHESRVYCDDCARARAATGQRRTTASSKARKERAKACQSCRGPLPEDRSRATRYCPTCAPIIAAEKQAASMERYKAKKKVQQTEGDIT